MSPFTTIINLAYFIGGIQNYVTVFGGWIFDSNVPLALPLTCDNLEYYWTYDDVTKISNGYKGLLKSVGFFPTEKIYFFKSKDTGIMFDAKNITNKDESMY